MLVPYSKERNEGAYIGLGVMRVSEPYSSVEELRRASTVRPEMPTFCCLKTDSIHIYYRLYLVELCSAKRVAYWLLE